MANDDEFIIGGKRGNSSSSQGTPKTSNSQGGASAYSGIKLGTMPSASLSFAARVAKASAIQKTSVGRRRSKTSRKARNGRYNSRGRGAKAMSSGIAINRSWQRFDGDPMRLRARRAIVKVSIIPLRGGTSRGAYSHLKYLQREGAGVEKVEGKDGELKLTETRGELYGPERGLEYDDKSFLERSETSFEGRGDPNQFRLILSPEDGVDAARSINGKPPSLQRQTRQFMNQMEEDLGTRLDWVAVDHFDTAHPHTHVVLRGVLDNGKELRIAGEYISEGMRSRYENIITRELGLKPEHEIISDLSKETKLNRVTTLDRAISPRIDAASSILDLREGHFRMHPDSAINRHLLTGRMKHLETLGLAQPTDKGRWYVERHTFDTLGDMHRNETITKEMSQAMKRVNISRQMQLHGKEAPLRKITGRVIGKGLVENESSGRLRIIIDGDDGYVHAVETGPETRASEARLGSVVEVGPAKLGPVDRTILKYAQDSGIDKPVYDIREHSDDLHKQGRYAILEGQAEHDIDMHRRRMSTLVKAGLARPYMSDEKDRPYSWVITEDFEKKVLVMDRANNRKTGLKLLSIQNLKAQLKSPGATWLDRVQLSFDKDTAGKQGYGADLHRAVAKRQTWLVEQGLATRNTNKTVSYEKGYVQTLIDREVGTQAAKTAEQTGKTYRALEQGMQVEGVFTDKIELMSGPYAVLQSQRAFYLVPWRSVMEQERGRRLTGTMRGKSVSWQFGRSRNQGLGR